MSFKFKCPGALQVKFKTGRFPGRLNVAVPHIVTVRQLAGGVVSLTRPDLGTLLTKVPENCMGWNVSVFLGWLLMANAPAPQPSDPLGFIGLGLLGARVHGLKIKV